MNCAKLLRDPRSDLWYHGLSEPWLVYIFPPDKLESSSFATEWNSENLFFTQRSSVSQIIFCGIYKAEAGVVGAGKVGWGQFCNVCSGKSS